MGANGASLESLIQELVESELRYSAQPSTAKSPVRSDAVAAREAERLAALLGARREVQHEALAGAGRLLGVRYQPPPLQPPRPSARGKQDNGGCSVAECATVWALVQPTKAATLRPTVSVAAGTGITVAGVDASVDFSRHSGVDFELEVQPGGVWSGEAGIVQRLPVLPITLSHAVKASQGAARTAQRSRAVQLKHTSAAGIPLPRCASELAASIQVPSTLVVPALRLVGDDGMEPLPSAASMANAAGPPGHSAAQRCKVTLQLRPQGRRVELGKKKEQQGQELSDSNGGGGSSSSGEASSGGTGSGSKPKSRLPQFKVEALLPAAGPAARVAARDVSCEWRQAWGKRVSSRVTWRHVGAKGSGNGSGSSNGSSNSSGRARWWQRGWVRLGGGRAVAASGSEGTGACLPAESPSLASLAGSSLEPSACSTASLAAVAAGPTSPQLGCDLDFRLHKGLMLGGSATLDASALEFASWGGSGGGWRQLPLSSPTWSSLAAAFKQGRVRLKYKLGSSKGSGSGVGGSQEGRGLQASILLSSSFCGLADPCHTLAWQQGGKGGGWDDGQRARSEVRVEVQPAARRRSLKVDVFLPLG